VQGVIDLLLPGLVLAVLLIVADGLFGAFGLILEWIRTAWPRRW
jgi:hypothetical protein